MSGTVIILCIVFLIAYAFDISSKKTRIPSVLLFMCLGWLSKIISKFWGFNLDGLDAFLPIFGTIGLVLIVLEGSLELEFHRSKKSIMLKSALLAISPFLVLSIGIALILTYVFHYPFKFSLANAIPLGVISSAIAIPSAKILSAKTREFVIYESSLSDIVGVLLFNFITLNDNITFITTGNFLLSILIMVLISLLATLVLTLLIGGITYSVKFMPIIIMIILIYYISKYYHLPALVFVLILGLVLGNIGLLESIPVLKKFTFSAVEREVNRFHNLISEVTFLVRALFFITFGFLIEAETVLNIDTILWSMGIVIAIYVVRVLHLRMLKLPIANLWFIAPRGLITILLFLSIPAGESIPFINNSLIIQVIVITALVMMLGMILSKKEGDTVAENKH